MTISATYTPAQASGNGVTVAFPFTFKTFEQADLVVIITDADDVDTTQTITTHYTVSLNADQNNNPGGTVTMLTAPASGTTLTIARELDALQETDIANGGGFYPEVLEDAFDRLTMLSQQNSDAIDRSFSLPVTVSGVNTELPVPAANNIVGWNETGTALQNYDSSVFATVVSFGTAEADIFSGDGVTVAFTLTANPGALNNLDVSIAGVTQTPGVDYTWTSGTTITFTTAPPSGAGNVLVRYMQGLPSGITTADSVVLTKSDGSTATIAENSREKLTANRTYYVRTDGNDANTGLANTAGGAFLTIQKALNVIDNTLDLNGYIATIQVADGTYTAGATASGAWVGGGDVYILGNLTTPANCIVNTTSADAFFATKGATLLVSGFKITTTTSGCAVKANLNSYIAAGVMNYGACAESHLEAGTGATIIAGSNYTISGGAVSHLHCGAPGTLVVASGVTVTLTGTPAFSAYFAGVAEGTITAMGVTWSGSATGTKFLAHKNGVIDVGTGNLNTLPGSVAGTVENGGRYCDISGTNLCVWTYNGSVYDGINNLSAGASAQAQYLLQTDAGAIFLTQQSIAGGGVSILQSTPYSGMWVGTTNAKYLALLTDNTVALIATAEQNIGIGRTPNARSSSGNLEVNGNITTGTPVSLTGVTTHTVADDAASFIIACAASLTLTLPAASACPGRWLYLVNQAAFTVVSASSNVVPLAGGAAGTAILAATAGKYAWLQSDGTNWQIMAAN